MMRCAVCGADCPTMEHEFIEGLPPESYRSVHERMCERTPKPRILRKFTRAVYFSDPLFGGDDVDFCSGACSLKWHEAKRAKRAA